MEKQFGPKMERRCVIIFSSDVINDPSLEGEMYGGLLSISGDTPVDYHAVKAFFMSGEHKLRLTGRRFQC